MAVHEEYIEMRIKNVCKGGVDAVIDFVSSSRTVGRATKVLKEACILLLNIIIIIIINEYLEAGLTASISIQHINCTHELQQELY